MRRRMSARKAGQQGHLRAGGRAEASEGSAGRRHCVHGPLSILELRCSFTQMSGAGRCAGDGGVSLHAVARADRPSHKEAAWCNLTHDPSYPFLDADTASSGRQSGCSRA